MASDVCVCVCVIKPTFGTHVRVSLHFFLFRLAGVMPGHSIIRTLSVVAIALHRGLDKYSYVACVWCVASDAPQRMYGLSVSLTRFTVCDVVANSSMVAVYSV